MDQVRRWEDVPRSCRFVAEVNFGKTISQERSQRVIQPCTEILSLAYVNRNPQRERQSHVRFGSLLVGTADGTMHWLDSGKAQGKSCMTAIASMRPGARSVQRIGQTSWFVGDFVPVWKTVPSALKM